MRLFKHPLSVNFEWKNAMVLLTFKTGVSTSAVAVVEAEGVTNLKCPHLLPWGPSSSVNSMAFETVADGKFLTIRMQSGDELEICCQKVTFRRAPE